MTSTDGPSVTPAFELFLLTHAHELCACIGPEGWQPLRSVARIAREELHEKTLRVALVDAVSQAVARLSSARSPGKEEFLQVEAVLRLVVAERPCCETVQSEFAKVLELIHGWLRVVEPRLTVSKGIEKAQAQHRSKTLLRSTDPRLWVTAVSVCPTLYQALCAVLLRWPCSYKDRIEMLEAGGARVVRLAPPTDAAATAAGLALAVKLSAGSEERVAALERASIGAMAAEALHRHPEHDLVVSRALSYLSNVGNCPEQWPGLHRLAVTPCCADAMRRFPSDPNIQEHAQRIIGVLDSYHEQSSSAVGRDQP